MTLLLMRGWVFSLTMPFLSISCILGCCSCATGCGYRILSCHAKSGCTASCICMLCLLPNRFAIILRSGPCSSWSKYSGSRTFNTGDHENLQNQVRFDARILVSEIKGATTTRMTLRSAVTKSTTVNSHFAQLEVRCTQKNRLGWVVLTVVCTILCSRRNRPGST